MEIFPIVFWSLVSFSIFTLSTNVANDDLLQKGIYIPILMNISIVTSILVVIGGAYTVCYFIKRTCNELREQTIREIQGGDERDMFYNYIGVIVLVLVEVAAILHASGMIYTYINMYQEKEVNKDIVIIMMSFNIFGLVIIGAAVLVTLAVGLYSLYDKCMDNYKEQIKEELNEKMEDKD